MQETSRDQSGAPANADRIAWLDYAKAIGIILVVVGHVAGGLRPERVGAGLAAYQTLSDFIYTFHMPLFFFISGYLSGLFQDRSASAFARATFIGIVVPYLLWSAIYVAVQNAFPGATNHLASFSDLLTIIWVPVAHLWFLHTLFFVRVGYFGVSRLAGRTAIGGLGGAALLGYVFALQWELPLARPLMGATLFAAGMLAAASRGAWPIPIRALPASAVAAALWFAAATAGQAPLSRWVLVVAAFAGVAMTVAASIALPKPRRLGWRVVALVGQASIAIYVAHMIFAAGTRYMLYGIGISDVHLHILLGTLTGVAAPTVMYLIANELRWAPFLGFGQNNRGLAMNARLDRLWGRFAQATPDRRNPASPLRLDA